MSTAELSKSGIIKQDDPRVRPYVHNPFLLLHSDPLRFFNLVWPEVILYDKQQEIAESVRDNDITIVPAGNDLGKDFIAALISLWFFLSRSPAFVVTSSVDGSQLEGVLWGEIRKFLRMAKENGITLPIQYNHQLIRQTTPDGDLEAQSRLEGRVVKVGEGLLGRHIPKKGPLWLPMTFVIFDEASAIEQMCFDTSDTWAHRMLIIGNPYECENSFKKFTKAGDLVRVSGIGLKRKVIRIRGEDSPNVRLAQKEIALGKKPSHKQLIPGVLSYELYLDRRKHWDPIKQSIGLDAEFYEGKEIKMFPEAWLTLSVRVARALRLLRIRRRAITMGLDSAQGNDSTVWTVIDKLGIMSWLSLKTHDTSDIPGRTIGMMHENRLSPDNVLLDRGGGGKEHADQIRTHGYEVRTIAFGEAASNPHVIENTGDVPDKKEDTETRYIYKNRRAEMYYLTRLAIEPSEECGLLDTTDEEEFIERVKYCVEHDIRLPFAIPETATDLLTQLRPIPLKYDPEGRIYMLPKNKKTRDSKEPTLTELLGRSPDEADSLVLAIFGREDVPNRPFAGAMEL